MSFCSNPDVLNASHIMLVCIDTILILSPVIVIIIIIKNLIKYVLLGENDIKGFVNKNFVKLIISLIILFIPTISRILLNTITDEESFLNCLKNATSENVEKAYLEEANKYVNTAKITKTNADVNKALYATEKVKDSNNKESLKKEIKNITIKDNKTDINLSNVTGNIEDDSGNGNGNNGNTTTTGGTYQNATQGQFIYHAAANGLMNYALYEPKNVTGKVPLIVWLHGGGEHGCSSKSLLNSGLLKVVNNWNSYNLKSIPAYIVSPHNKLNTDDDTWLHSSLNNNIVALISYITSNYNIDTSKIVLVGHSQGGGGVFYIAANNQTIFSKVVSMSATKVSGKSWFKDNINYLKNVPLKGYTEKQQLNSMNSNFGALGKKNIITQYSCSHGKTPEKALTEDLNNDGISDLIYWLVN